MLNRQNRLTNKGDFCFVYFENNKDNFKKQRLYTENFKIEKYEQKTDQNISSNFINKNDIKSENNNIKSEKDDIKSENIINKNLNNSFCKIRIIISSKKVKLAVNRNKIKRRIKYFFIHNILNNSNYSNKNQYIFITVIKKQDRDFKYRDITKELSVLL